MRRLLILLLVCVGALTTPTPAAAHTTLISGSPGPGESVTPGLEVMALTFGPLLEPRADAVRITGPDGAAVASGAPVVADGGGNDTLCLSVEALKDPGTYTVSYSVTSTDGDPLESAFQFAVDGSAEGAVTPPQCADRSLPAPGTASEASDVREAQAQEQEGQDLAQGADTGSGLSGTQWALVAAGAGVAVLAAVILLATGPRSGGRGRADRNGS
ncbi:copper resistance CopC family protein [Streptomyces sp. NPDC002845]